MKVEDFFNILDKDFFTGVPDSTLKPFCDYLVDRYGYNNKNHIVGANEGCCVGIAAGYYMATDKIPVIYLQNSGLGNSINPITSLLHEKIYGIPVIFLVGWRGDPGNQDEPQHLFQGQVTEQLLVDMEISYIVLDNNTTVQEFKESYNSLCDNLDKNNSIAILVKRDSFNYTSNLKKENLNILIREEVIERILKYSESDPIVSTTGKISREVFEVREKVQGNHAGDFLTVGSMGHASSIGLGLAMQTQRKVWCIDGDGAAIMHMGSMAVIGRYNARNLIHIVLNNEAHESVGGIKTCADSVSLSDVARACGYEMVLLASNEEELDKVLESARESKCLTFVEIKCSLYSRSNLGRPTISIKNNLLKFKEFFNE